MTIFFYEPSRGLVTPLDRRFYARPITDPDMLDEIKSAHSVTQTEPFPVRISDRETGSSKNLNQYLNQEAAPQQVVARELMSHPVVTIGESTSLTDAMAAMEHHSIHHLAVTNASGRLGGFISMQGLAVAAIKNNANVISDLEMPPLIASAPDTALQDLVHIMLGHSLSAIPVISENQLVGVVTLTDFLRHQARQYGLEFNA